MVLGPIADQVAGEIRDALRAAATAAAAGAPLAGVADAARRYAGGPRRPRQCRRTVETFAGRLLVRIGRP